MGLPARIGPTAEFRLSQWRKRGGRSIVLWPRPSGGAPVGAAWTRSGNVDNLSGRSARDLRAWRATLMSSPSTSDGVSPQTWAIIVWGLYLAAFVTFAITAVVAVITAYVKRGDLVGTPYESHMTSAIRTFWISLIVGVIGVILAFVGIGFVILGLLALW